MANVDADAAVVAVVVVVCAAFVLELHFHAEPHAERRQKRVRAREREARERGESREELYELFVLQLVFVRRVASRLLSAKPRSCRLHVGSALLWCRCLCVALAQLWHLPDVLLLL